MKMRIAKQILREFWLPFLIGLAWTYYRVSPGQSDLLAGIIANFAAAFFLASWALGHVLRIKRQHTVEDSFKGVEGHLIELKSTVGALSLRSQELQAQTKDNPALQSMADDISKLTSAASTGIAAANTAFSQAHTPAHEDHASWPFVWQKLLDHAELDSDRDRLLAMGREWLKGHEEQPEWPFVLQKLLNRTEFDSDQARLLAMGREWLKGNEERPEWPFVWQKLIDHAEFESDRHSLQKLGQEWLKRAEDRPGSHVIRRKLRDKE
jgi:hypothetical protein